MTTHAQTGNELHGFRSPRPTGKTEPAMARGIAFLGHELRRHVPTLALAFLVVAALPLASRAIEGSWRFWDGARNALAAAIAVYVLAPFLTIMMASTGWARERSLGLLDSLYSRPLSSRTIFVCRALAVAISVSLWTTAALAFTQVRWFELEQVLANLPGFPGPLALLLVAIGLALGAGLLTSALATSMEWAVRWAAALVIAVWLLAFGLPRVVGTALILRWAQFSSPFLAGVTTGFVATLALLFLALAWRAMSIAPDGPGRIRRMAPVGATAALTTIVIAAMVLHLPRLAGRESRVELWMGDNSALSFAAARAIGGNEKTDSTSLSHPIVRSAGHSTVLRDVYAVRYRGFENDGPWIEPTRGLAMMPAVLHDRSDWVLIDRSGETTAIPMPAPLFGEVQRAIGWAPARARFAWKTYRVSSQGGLVGASVVVFDHTRGTREWNVGSVKTYLLQAAWIDERTLLLAGLDGDPSAGWWTTLDVENGTLEPRQELKWSQLTAPALIDWDATQSRLPLLDGAPVALLESDARTNLWRSPEDEPAPPTLVRPDPTTGMLLPGPELPPRSLWSSMGSLDDGSLVWAQPEKTPYLPRWDGGTRTRIYRLGAIDGEPETLCSMPTGRLFGFRGRSGPWLVWDTGRLWARQGSRAPEYELWGCNLDTRESRVLREWSEWAHPLATITDRGLLTASGWVPLDR